MTDKVVIRTVAADERAAWEPLWNGYLAFYKATLAADATDVAWQRFHDPDEPMFVLGAYVEGRLTGIVHYLFHRSSWTVGNYCYLQDLFVAESARGFGLGLRLPAHPGMTLREGAKHVRSFRSQSTGVRRVRHRRRLAQQPDQ
jgi:GNAT superfamily N-acetyltransferase